MNNQANNERLNIDWHKISKFGILVCKLFLIIFILCIITTLTFKFTDSPYSYYLIGFEISMNSMFSFMIIRMSTYKQSTNLNPPTHVVNATEQARLL